MAIFAIGLLAVISMQLTALKGNSTSRYVTEAAIMAQEKVEEFYVLPYDHADLTAGNHGPIASGHYFYRWTVVDNGVIANTKTVTLNVEYQHRGTTKQVQVVTVKSALI